MEQSLDENYRDMLYLFNEEKVEYLLIGGWAVFLHAQFRYTEDIDLWVRASPENAKRIMVALRRFGAPLDDVDEKDFLTPKFGLHIGIPPCRIDILTKITGVTFDEAWKHKTTDTIGGISVNVIGKQQLLQNKQASAREKDLLDISAINKQRNIE